jgi:cytochrome b561
VLAHWITAALVLVLWVFGRNLDLFPHGDIRMQARSVHMLFGLVVLAVILERIWRRFHHPVAPPHGSPQWANRAAALMHLALYILVLAVIVVGLGTEWARGDRIFGLFKVTAFDPTHPAVRREWGDVHGLLANILLCLALAHAFAAVAHEFVWRDGVLSRMIPALRRT